MPRSRLPKVERFDTRPRNPPRLSKKSKNQTKDHPKNACNIEVKEFDYWYELAYKNTYFAYGLLFLFLLDTWCIEVAFNLLYNTIVCTFFVLASCCQSKKSLKYLLIASSLTFFMSIILIGINIATILFQTEHEPTYFAYSARKQWMVRHNYPAAAVGSFMLNLFYYIFIVCANFIRMRLADEILKK